MPEIFIQKTQHGACYAHVINLNISVVTPLKAKLCLWDFLGTTIDTIKFRVKDCQFCKTRSKITTNVIYDLFPNNTNIFKVWNRRTHVIPIKKKKYLSTHAVVICWRQINHWKIGKRALRAAR